MKMIISLKYDMDKLTIIKFNICIIKLIKFF
jgi:hypothetical protein